MFALTSKRLPPGILPSAAARVKFTDEPLKQTFSTLGEWSYQLGFERQPPDLSGLFDTGILTKLQQERPTAIATQPGL